MPERPAKRRPPPRADTRRGGGLKRLPDLLTKLLDPAARRRGLIEARLLTDWPAIVGPALAARCQPMRLSGARSGQGGVLWVHVGGASALELQHSEPQVIERINTHFGHLAVARLRLQQAPLPRPASPAPPTPPPAPPSAERLAAIDATVAEVAEPELRAALASLGRTLAGRRDGGGGG
jgi:hypothetical protein